MTDLLKEGSAWLEQKRAAYCSSLVTYSREGEEFELNATFGKTDFDIEDIDGLTVASHVWDFLILAEDLGFEPQPGDVIVANGRRHEVLPFSDDDYGWRWSDAFRQTYRIHTRDIGESI